MVVSDNIIRQLLFTIDIKRDVRDTVFYDEITNYFSEEIPKEIERYIDVNNHSSSVAIDRIELDLGHISMMNWKLNLQEVFRSELTKVLDDIDAKVTEEELHIKDVKSVSKADVLITKPKTTSQIDFENNSIINGLKVSPLNKEQNAQQFRVFIFYLDRGYFPWWHLTKTSEIQKEIFSKMVLSRAQKERVLQLVSRKSESLKRCLAILPSNKILALFNLTHLKVLSESQINQIQILLKESKLLKIKANDLKFSYWSYILQNPKEISEANFEHLSRFIISLLSVSKQKENINFKKSLVEVFNAISKTFALKDEVIKSNALLLKQCIASHKKEIKEQKRSNQKMTGIFKASEKENAKLNPKKEKEGLESYKGLSSLSKDIEKEEQEGVYVNFAGIVLLHPFLAPLFSSLNLLENNQFRSKEAQIKSVHLLAKLAFGNSDYTEHDCLLLKHLCGLSWDTFIDIDYKIKRKELNEINNLLLSVINHWQAVKGTSVDGLRDGFFNREGKLWKDENIWHLHVEQKAQDILLERLPWGINLIKLPWLNELLKITWI